MLPLLRKSTVKAHTRKTKSGKVAQVRAHTDSRSKKAAPVKGIKAKTEAIAQLYADILHKKLVKMHGPDYGHDGSVTDSQRTFARAVLKKDVYALKFITNGLNQAALKTFTKTTGVKMPRSQSGQWAELLKWGGVSKKHDEKVTKNRDAHFKFELAQKRAEGHTVRFGDKDMSIRQAVDDLIGRGYTHYSQTPNKKKEHYLVKMGDDGKRLAIKLSGKAALRPAIEYAQAHAEFEKTKLKKSRSLHGRMDFQGLKISIENRKGSLRQWYDPHNKTSGTTRMKYPYGYIRLTEGNDGDHVDCYVGSHKDAKNAYIVHQMKAPDFKKYDEDKVMLGFEGIGAARTAYLAHYNNKRFLGSITSIPMEDFNAKVLATKDKPGKISKAMSGVFLIKSHVKGHVRRSKSGKVSTVREHEDSRKKTKKEDFESSQVQGRKAKRLSPFLKQLRAEIREKRSSRTPYKYHTRMLPLSMRLDRFKEKGKEQKRVDAVLKNSNIEYWDKADIDRILKKIGFDSISGANFEIQKANLKGLASRFKKEGWELTHTSKHEGRVSSYYFIKNDVFIRVSDHELPLTAERQFNRDQGYAGKWDIDIIINHRTDISVDLSKLISAMG